MRLRSGNYLVDCYDDQLDADEKEEKIKGKIFKFPKQHRQIEIEEKESE